MFSEISVLEALLIIFLPILDKLAALLACVVGIGFKRVDDF